MSKETKVRVSEELWHLGIGDLLAPANRSAPAVLAGPFVINLRTSASPIGGISNALQRFEHLHVYRLERRHEGRPQFLLRVGIIETDLEADTILLTLREEYPGASKASAGDDDRKAVAATARVATARRAKQRSGPKRPEALATPRNSPAAAAGVAAGPQPPFRWNIDEVLPELGAPRMAPQPHCALTPDAPQSPAAAQNPKNPAQPAGPRLPLMPPLAESSIAAPPQTSATDAASCPDSDPNAVTDQVEALLFTFGRPTFEAEAPQPPVIEAAEAPIVQSASSDGPDFEAAAVGSTAVETNTVEPLEPRPACASRTDSDGEGASAEGESALPQPLATEAAPPSVREVTDAAFAPAGVTPEPPTESEPADVPQIDRTRTVRALTPLELEDRQSSPWFAIQLMLSEEEIDPHQVPNLSIFAEYRLYAVTGLDQDRRMHALRLGFFSSETAAAAVAGYLATSFDVPSIKRVSAAEHERFEEQRLMARKDVEAVDGHVVIELAAPAPSLLRQARDRLHAQRKHNTPKAGSIWSRLIPSRKS